MYRLMQITVTLLAPREMSDLTAQEIAEHLTDGTALEESIKSVVEREVERVVLALERAECADARGIDVEVTL